MVRLTKVVATLILCGLALTTLAFAKTNESKTQAPTVRRPIKFAISPAMSEVQQSMPSPDFDVHEVRSINRNLNFGLGTEDGALQSQFGPLIGGTQGIDFEGIGVNGGEPSDSNMAVGPNNLVEIVNSEWAVYDKTGHIAAGFPKTLGSIWSALGGACAGEQGDPIVQYDRLADRWFLSQIGSESAPYSLCTAVSKTNDPTGAYFLYQYSFGSNFPDYPHYSVWPTATNSAYLQMSHLFLNLQSFVGTAACAYDRTAMLAGAASPVQICFTIANDGGYQPSDLDGSTPPPDGSPGYFVTFETTSLYEYQLGPNFADPGASTFTGPINIPVSSFSPACGGSGGTCIPQKGTSQQLDTLGDRMMYRLAYRNFGDHEAMVVNHTVTSGSSNAPRWYEIRSPLTPTVFQQGTYAPDSTDRWMGSIAMDKAGDMLLGYSISSSTIDPGIAYTGRIPSDTAGTMESENILLTGTHYQTGHTRWGDYSAMRIDPADDCTFWYVDQYAGSNGDFVWATHIGSFVFNNCSGSPNYSLSANPNTLTVTQGSSGTSTITVNPVNGFSGSVTLAASGLPNGVTAGFGTNPTTSTSVLTLTASATATTGTATVTITGTSGSLTQQTTISLTVQSSNSGAAVTLSPTSLAFANTIVGATTSAKSVTLTNSGSATLNISSILASGDFALAASTKPCGSTLAAGKSCILKVTFTPTQVGARTGAVTIADNASGSPQTVPLSGNGEPQATLSPTSRVYASQKVGTTSAAKAFTLANKQNVALTSISIGTTGDFSVSSTTCSTSLAAKTSCTISVVFTPTQTGTRTGSLQVSDSASNSPQTSALDGVGK